MSMVRKWAGSGLWALLVAGAGWTPACGTDAVGVETCRQVEEARCRQAPKCPEIDLSKPRHRDTPNSDVDACIRFYRDACLHGLATNADPGALSLRQCVDAINRGDCAVVEHPESDPACFWLVPPQPPAPPADASDAPVDAPADTAPSDAGLGLDVGFPFPFPGM
jgi:hypothetical protein